MPDLDPTIEQRLAELSDADWAALTARVRPPTSAAQLRDIAGRVITGDALEAFVNIADLKSLSAPNGDVDEDKVMGTLTGMFGIIPETTAQHQDFGQHRPPPPTPGPGEAGRAEAARRFGGQHGTAPAAARGQAGAAEAERRFTRKGIQQ